MRSSEWPVWHCQLEATAATVAGCLTMWRAIPATGSRPRLSATPSRFTLSFRDVEDLLAQRGITVSYESIRHWCETFGLACARRLRRRAGPVGDTWHLDELFVTIRGQRQYLWTSGGPLTRTASSSTSCSSPAGIAALPRGSFARCSSGAA